jgi:hypothetical protein
MSTNQQRGYMEAVLVVWNGHSAMHDHCIMLHFLALVAQTPNILNVPLNFITVNPNIPLFVHVLIPTYLTKTKGTICTRNLISSSFMLIIP